MGLKITRLAVAFLLGIILAVYPVVAMQETAPAVKSCCQHHKGGRCCNMPCCAAQNGPSAPVTPGPVPSAPQNSLQVMAASVISLLPSPSPEFQKFSTRFSFFVQVTPVPLFQ